MGHDALCHIVSSIISPSVYKMETTIITLVEPQCLISTVMETDIGSSGRSVSEGSDFLSSCRAEILRGIPWFYVCKGQNCQLHPVSLTIRQLYRLI